MKRSAYKKSWNIILIATVMVVIGLMYEPLIVALGMTVIFTSVLASSIERKNRRYEGLIVENAFDGGMVATSKIGFVPHRAV